VVDCLKVRQSLVFRHKTGSFQGKEDQDCTGDTAPCIAGWLPSGVFVLRWLHHTLLRRCLVPKHRLSNPIFHKGHDVPASFFGNFLQWPVNGSIQPTNPHERRHPACFSFRDSNHTASGQSGSPPQSNGVPMARFLANGMKFASSSKKVRNWEHRPPKYRFPSFEHRPLSSLNLAQSEKSSYFPEKGEIFLRFFQKKLIKDAGYRLKCVPSHSRK